MNNLPKYTRSLKGSLHYQRAIPTRLKHLTPKSVFNYPLSLKSNEASESSIARAHSEATSAFELHCKMLENSDPDAFSTDELEQAALDILRKHRLQSGQFTYSAIEGFDGVDLADDKIWVEEIRGKEQAGEKLSFEEKAQLIAWGKLWNAKSTKPQTMTSFWQDYAKEKGLVSDSRDTKRRESRWLRWLKVIGNHKIAPNTLELIHQGLDTYVNERLESVAPSTVKREMADILAVLRAANQRHRYGWMIQPTKLPRSQTKKKKVLSHEEQRMVINYCLSQPNSNVAACVLLQLQGAMMPSEVQRLTDTDIALDASVPHIVISGDTKTVSRKRIIPVVLGLGYIREKLNRNIEWLTSTTESAHSHAIKKLLVTATGNDKLTGHCLRHTFRANSIANGATTNATLAIAGWSGSSLGISSEMLAYGAEGLANSDVLKGLQRESLKIHKHLLKDDNKVVQLRTA